MAAGVSGDCVFIVDWDDTLLATTHYSLHHLNEEEKRQLADSIDKLFQTLRQLGKIFIVTNSNLTWVHASIHQMFPNITELRNTPIVSAFDTYKAKMPRPDEYNAQMAWYKNAKKDAILTIIQSHDAPIKRLVSIGDSTIERDAAREACTELNISFCTIKMCEYPTVKGLIHQHNILCNSLHHVSNPKRTELKELVMYIHPSHTHSPASVNKRPPPQPSTPPPPLKSL